MYLCICKDAVLVGGEGLRRIEKAARKENEVFKSKFEANSSRRAVRVGGHDQNKAHTGEGGLNISDTNRTH